MGVYDGHGTSITFGTSAFSAKLLSVDGPAVERDAIDITTMASDPAKEFTPADLYDPGGVDCEFEFNGGDEPPIDGAVETITLDFGGQGAGYKWVGSGFLTNFRPSAAIGERMRATMTLKLTGELTPASS